MSKTQIKKKLADEPVLIGEERLNAARSLIDKIKIKNCDLIQLMSNLFEAYIEFANYNIEQNKKNLKQQIPIPKTLSINRIKNYANIPVLTAELTINKDANYLNIPYIMKFENTFSLVINIHTIVYPNRLIQIGSKSETNIYLMLEIDFENLNIWITEG